MGSHSLIGLHLAINKETSNETSPSQSYRVAGITFTTTLSTHYLPLRLSNHIKCKLTHEQLIR